MTCYKKFPLWVAGGLPTGLGRLFDTLFERDWLYDGMRLKYGTVCKQQLVACFWILEILLIHSILEN